jgi:hypothetical protein
MTLRPHGGIPSKTRYTTRTINQPTPLDDVLPSHTGARHPNYAKAIDLRLLRRHWRHFFGQRLCFAEQTASHNYLQYLQYLQEINKVKKR